MRRRKKRNPAGKDVVGFLVGLALPFGAGLLLGGGGAGVALVACGEVLGAGVAAALGGANEPGFFRGAAVGGAVMVAGSAAMVVYQQGKAVEAARRQNQVAA
jgi:hypothetical protein